MFCNISKRNLWDLHLHTRASNVRKHNDYPGQGFSFNDNEITDFVNHVFFEGGPKMIAITDHDYFDASQFLKIKGKVKELSEFRKVDLNVLPGVELDIKFKLNNADNQVTSSWNTSPNVHDSDRCHCVLIFNDDNKNNYEEISKIISDFYPIDDTPIYLDDILLEFVDKKIEFIAIPHFTKDNGIENALPDNETTRINDNKKINRILSGYFPLLDGKVRDFINERVQKIYREIKEHRNGMEVPIIVTTDNHDYQIYEDNYKVENGKHTYYKALPTFKGLRMCLTDYNQRVSYDYSCNHNAYIKNIIIKNLNDNDCIYETNIELSNCLNCVIGGRSSGKSFLLREIVGAAKYDHDNAAKLKGYSKFYNKVKIELLDANGNRYVGEPEFYDQGSIIKKYENSSNGSSLQQEFKEYFPQEFDEQKIMGEKDRLVKLLMDYNSNLIKIANLKNNIISKNSIEYFRIESNALENVVSNNEVIEKTSLAIKTVDDLNAFKRILENGLELIKPFQSLTNKVEQLIDEVNNIYVKADLKKDCYIKIKEISQSCIDDINNCLSDKNKRQKMHLIAFTNFVNDIVEFCNLYETTLENIEKIKELINVLKKTQTISSQKGKFKFNIRITNNINISLLLNVFKDYLKSDYSNVKSFKGLTQKVLDIGYINNISKKLQNMLQDTIEKSYMIEYLIYENKELINEMSEGRKVSVFLSLLLTKEGIIEPLIIDQPEDDMDNSDIYKILVDTIRKTKTHRQIILATHDSNIVVNGDSENVIFAKKIKRSKLKYVNGALEYHECINGEDINIQKIICDTLEGGEKAFITRAEKYDINKLKLHEWRKQNDH